MKGLIRFFLRYPVGVNTVLVALALFGYQGYKNLNSTFFPVVESRFINVTAVFPGASPEEVEEGIVRKVEEKLKGLKGVDRITSTSAENLATVSIEMRKGFNMDDALEDVKNAVNSIASFPSGMEPILVFKRENINFAISFAISSDQLTLGALKAEARRIEEDLLSYPGISKVTLTGFPEEEIEVAFREEDLRAYGITFAQAAQAIRSSNLLLTGGTIKGSEEELLIRARNKGYRSDELDQIVLKATPAGQVIRLRDVANVQDRWADTPDRTEINGQRAVGIVVNATDDEDLLGISAHVNQYIKDYQAASTNIKATVIRDFAITLEQRQDLLFKNGIAGVLLVLLFLSLFLNWRLAFWVALGIPVAFLGMFFLVQYMGVTINVISLFGMIVVVGILVDDGIVISENIYQHYQMGKSPLKAAMDGTLEVLPAVFTAVLTTMVAFATFFFLDGRPGDFFSQMALIVMVTLAVSLVEAMLFLPAHISHAHGFNREGRVNRFEQTMNGVMDFMRFKLYQPVLEFLLKYRFLGLIIPIAWMVITIGAFQGGQLKATFFPFIDRENLDITLNMPAGTTDSVTNHHLNTIEAAAWKVNEDIKARRGDGLGVIVDIEKNLGPQPFQGRLNVIFLDAERRLMPSFEITNAIRDAVGPINEAEVLTYGSAQAFGKPVSISLVSYNLTELNGAREMLKEKMKAMTALRDVVDNSQPGVREVLLTLKDKAYLLGLTEAEVMNQVRQGFFGFEAQRLQRGRDEVKVWVRYDEASRQSLFNLEDMRIRTPDGGAYPLREIADYRLERGEININHLDGKREIKVEADLANPNESAPEILGRIRDEVMPEINQQYPSVAALYEGQNREAMRTAASSQKVLPLVIAVIILLITFVFRSFFQTVVIFLLIPLAFPGVALGHAIHGMPMSIFSYLGMIALIGIIVNDSLVLVSKMNQSLKEGMPFEQALRDAGLNRFRAIFLTTATTVAGLGPLILEKSFQAQFLVPMAVSVAYGIAYATLLTLVTLPVLLSYANDLRRFVKALRTGTWPTAEAVEPAIVEMKDESEVL
jgi:multidrug efflux pump subunit AcrB